MGGVLRRPIVLVVAAIVVLAAGAGAVWAWRDDGDRAEPGPGEMVRIVAPGDLAGSGVGAVGVVPGPDEELVLLPIGEPVLLFVGPDGHLEEVDVSGLGETPGLRQLAVAPDGTIWIATPGEELLQRISPTNDGPLEAEDVSLADGAIPTAVAVHPDGGVVVGDGRGGILLLDDDGRVVDEAPYPDTLAECPYEPGLEQVVVDDVAPPGPTDVHVAADGTVFAAGDHSCPGLWRTSFDSPDDAAAVLGEQRCPANGGSPEPDGVVSVDEDTLVVADHYCPGFWIVRSGAEPELVEVADNPDRPTYPWDGPQDLAVGVSGTLYLPSPHGVFALRLR